MYAIFTSACDKPRRSPGVRTIRVLLLLVLSATPAGADGGSVGLGWFTEAAPLLAYAPPAAPLISGAALNETPSAGFGAAFRAEFLTLRAASPTGFAAALRDLIASVEADSRSYDTVHLSARVLPEKPPSRMTIAEIRAWTKATPGQQHAIGRYQIIPKTLEMLVDRLGIPDTARFSPALQDRMADALIADAGLEAMLAGQISREQFLDGLAGIWAGLPAASGRSAYHGLAGNRAGMSRDTFRTRFADILPGSG